MYIYVRIKNLFIKMLTISLAYTITIVIINCIRYLSAYTHRESYSKLSTLHELYWSIKYSFSLDLKKDVYL